MGRSTMPPPFASFTILEAIDVLSAEGSLAELPALVDGLALARSILEIISTMWEDGKVHKMALDHRLDKLASLRDTSRGGNVEPAVQIQGLRVFTRPPPPPSSSESHNNLKDGRRLLQGGEGGGGQCWQMGDALEMRFPSEMDCVYTSLATF